MMISDLKLNDEEFEKFRKVIYESVGINLLPQKKIMLQGRIRKRLKKLDMYSFEEYYELILKDERERMQMFNVVSTNKTEFFRENHHFEFLEEIIPNMIEENKKVGRSKFSVWCSASSTGEEPYTIAMVLNKFSALKNFTVKVIASDISTDVLEKGMDGEYKAELLEKIPSEYVEKNFSKTSDDMYKVKKHLRDMIKFKRINLVGEDYPFKGEFEIIFCRNVMIYFDRETQSEIIYRFLKVLKKGGYLILGSSESLPTQIAKSNLLKRIKSTIYQKL